MAAIEGLTEVQNLALAGVQVGDLILVERWYYGSNGEEEFESDNEGWDEEGESEVEDGDSELEDEDSEDDELGSEIGDESPEESDTDDVDPMVASSDGYETTMATTEDASDNNNIVDTNLGSNEHHADEAEPVQASNDGWNTTAVMTEDNLDVDGADTNPETSEDQSEEDEGAGTNEADSANDNNTTAKPPRMYLVCKLDSDESETITEINLVELKYALHPNKDLTPEAPVSTSYQLYGTQCTHNLSASNISSLTNDASKLLKIQDLVEEETFGIHANPTGDIVRHLLFNGRCPANCHNGWLEDLEDLTDMIKDYTITTSLPHRPVCPCCIGVDLMKEHQQLREDLEAFGLILDVGAIVEFYGRLNPRRQQVGYAFKQFDEREWGMMFDDMISDDDDDDDGSAGGGGGDGYEHWAEALDPSNNVQLHPASKATIAALPRKVFSEMVQAAEGKQRQVDTACKVCQMEFGCEQVVIELPCGHVFCEGGCIELWLHQFDTCPTCRGRVPALVAEAKDGQVLKGGMGAQDGLDGLERKLDEDAWGEQDGKDGLMDHEMETATESW